MGASRDITEEANRETAKRAVEQANELLSKDVKILARPETLYSHDEDGGLYRLLGPAQYKRRQGKDWKLSVLYQDVNTGAYYVTSPERWEERFSHAYNVNQD